METILKMYFKRILNKVEEVDSITTIEQLCKAATFYLEDIVQIFAAMNDEEYGLSSRNIVDIANEVYEELV